MYSSFQLIYHCVVVCSVRGDGGDLFGCVHLPHDVFFVTRERDGQFVEDLVLGLANPASPNFRWWFSKIEVTRMVRDEVSHQVVNDFLLAWEM